MWGYISTCPLQSYLQIDITQRGNNSENIYLSTLLVSKTSWNNHKNKDGGETSSWHDFQYIQCILKGFYFLRNKWPLFSYILQQVKCLELVTRSRTQDMQNLQLKKRLNWQRVIIYIPNTAAEGTEATGASHEGTAMTCGVKVICDIPVTTLWTLKSDETKFPDLSGCLWSTLTFAKPIVKFNMLQVNIFLFEIMTFWMLDVCRSVASDV